MRWRGEGEGRKGSESCGEFDAYIALGFCPPRPLALKAAWPQPRLIDPPAADLQDTCRSLALASSSPACRPTWISRLCSACVEGVRARMKIATWPCLVSPRAVISEMHDLHAFATLQSVSLGQMLYTAPLPGEFGAKAIATAFRDGGKVASRFGACIILLKSRLKHLDVQATVAGGVDHAIPCLRHAAIAALQYCYTDTVACRLSNRTSSCLSRRPGRLQPSGDCGSARSGSTCPSSRMPSASTLAMR